MIPIKIAHLSDVHIGPYPGPFPLARYYDIEKILDWTADRIIAEKVDLVLVAGDCFKDAKVMLDRASQEIVSIIRFLKKISSAGIEIIVISGTPSHDAIPAYDLMKEMLKPYPVQIHTQPFHASVTCATRNDLDTKIFYEKASIACLPGLNRSALMTQDEYKGLPPEQIHRIMTDKITQLCMGMAAQMPDDKPKILMAHMTYQGADKGFDDLLMQHEPILTREAVQGFDLVCLGHIHRPQEIGGKVYYSGPIERLSFNEQDIKPGFYIHEIINWDGCKDKCLDIQSQFIETPARRYVTLDWDEEQIEGFSKHDTLCFGDLFAEQLKDAIVRLHYSCSEEVAKQLNRKQLEKSLYDAGAFFVSEIKADIERSDRARDNTVNESLSVPHALEKWCINQNIDELEIKELVSMASGLMEQSSCS